MTKQPARVPRALTRFLLEEVLKQRHGGLAGKLTDGLSRAPCLSGLLLGPGALPKPAAAPRPSRTLSSGDTTCPRPADVRVHAPGSRRCDDLAKFSLPQKPNANRCVHPLIVTVTEIHVGPLRPSLASSAAQTHREQELSPRCEMNGMTTLENRLTISYKYSQIYSSSTTRFHSYRL